ncbi:TniQ family protein [Streptomyces sp. NBC_01571]|uniref:TniQ family protein n=1 Tax=Streptomyces sp. NBC_01571 TaxID=2975883 RepID=UPI00224DFB35|nr:TniQ family protein [Streptomyces sp. NBC_01571]MCX4571911.1 TniQ family protein [Streptomyces sp. NBC_01571]MCX4578175.1 TniQ family protein [Streptomyces sp. NBC_01571]
MTEAQEQRLHQLPVQIRPRPGEPTDSYIRRLARANHLKPSYLHGFLTGSPNWFGKPRLERLAALTGRPPEQLEHVLADASSPRRRRKPGPNPTPVKKPNKRELYRRIRHDAETEGLSLRSLVRRHNVTWRTVRAALDSLEPRPRKPLPRRPTAIDPVQHLIDSMIESGHGRPRDIWVKLMDEHETSISYGTIRQYVQDREPRRPRRRTSLPTNPVRPGHQPATD